MKIIKITLLFFVLTTYKSWAQPANSKDSTAYALGKKVAEQILKEHDLSYKIFLHGLKGAYSGKEKLNIPASNEWKFINTEHIEFNTAEDTLSYLLGYRLLESMPPSLEIDMTMFIKGVLLSQDGKNLLPNTDAQQFLLQYANTMTEKYNKKQRQFLEDNMQKEGVVTTASGLQYMIIEEGSGEKPSINDTVVCHYRGSLIDGKVFDSSYDRGEPLVTSIRNLIQGWQEALVMMNEGAKWKLFIPAELGYGNQSIPGIAPGSTLIFDMELISRGQ